MLFGLTLPLLISRMNFSPESAEEKRDSMSALLRRVGESAIDTLGPLDEQTVDGERLDPAVVGSMRERILPRLVTGSRQDTETKPDSIAQSLIVQRRYLDAMRDALSAERSIGAYSSGTYRQVEAMLDTFEQRFGG